MGWSVGVLEIATREETMMHVRGVGRFRSVTDQVPS